MRPIQFLWACALALAAPGVGAQFEDAEVRLHPDFSYAHGAHPGPFVLEITGTWPDDCHPGEQKPVIRAWDGENLLVEFEIIVVHVTCNDFPTPYRVLVDLSDAGERFPRRVNLTVRYGEALLERRLTTNCALCDPPPPPGRPTWPDPGLYAGRGLDLQGLLIARQNEWVAVYPLTYDEGGASEWLFAAHRVHGNVLFADLHRLSGGQCLGCPPAGATPGLEVIGKLTLLMDSSGQLHLKLDDDLFLPFELLDFAYGELPGTDPPIPDLSGRWALARSDTGPFPNGSIPPADALPAVFDVEFSELAGAAPAVARFKVSDLQGDEVTTLRCQWGEQLDCLLLNPGFDDLEHAYRVELASPVRLRLTDTGPILAVGVAATGELVRVD